jgi:hypothetical protein
MARTYKTNLTLWAPCSAVVLCFFIAFEPGLGGEGTKFGPLREDFISQWEREIGRMPIAIVLEFVFVAVLIFGIPSAALGWVIQAFGIVAWSRLTSRKTVGEVPSGMPKGPGQP